MSISFWDSFTILKYLFHSLLRHYLLIGDLAMRTMNS